MDIVSGAGELQSNPFFILTFIVAPAILTNASALMVLSTSNRFARAVDRARDLSRQVEEAKRKEEMQLLPQWRCNNASFQRGSCSLKEGCQFPTKGLCPNYKCQLC